MRLLAILALAVLAGWTSADIKSQLDGSSLSSSTRPRGDVALVLERPETGGRTISQTSGSSDWANGWMEVSTSSRMWMPSDFSSSSVSVQWRDGHPAPPAFVDFGVTNHEGRNDVIYRGIHAEEPVWNSERRSNLVLPDNTMAVHLDWWHYMPTNAWMQTGKRIGFESHPHAAGGAKIAGAVDRSEGPLGLSGGWSTRFYPNKIYSSSSNTYPERYSFYSYMQNRKAFGAKNQSDGRLFGATRSTEGGTAIMGSWVRLSWTLIMNSPFNADGESHFWVNGVLRETTTGILWQEDIAKHPIRSFYLSWMYGGTPQQLTPHRLVPERTFREYYGDARIGVNSRDNALDNPWPF